MKQKIKMRPDQRKGYFMVLIAGCLWGTNGFFCQYPWRLRRTVFHCGLFKACSCGDITRSYYAGHGRKKLFKIDKYGLLACLALGIFSQALFNYSYNEAIDHIGVAMACILAYTSPIFVCIMSRLFLKKKSDP